MSHARSPGGPRPQATPHRRSPRGVRFKSRVHAGASGGCSHRLYTPGGHAGRPLPLVVMLHGCTQSPEDIIAGTRMNEVTEEAGPLVAYPKQTRASLHPRRDHP